MMQQCLDQMVEHQTQFLLEIQASRKKMALESMKRKKKNKTLEFVLDNIDCNNCNGWYLPIAIFLSRCQSLKCNQQCPNHCLYEQWFYIYAHHLLGGTPNHHMQKDFQVLRNSENQLWNSPFLYKNFVSLSN